MLSCFFWLTKNTHDACMHTNTRYQKYIKINCLELHVHQMCHKWKSALTRSKAKRYEVGQGFWKQKSHSFSVWTMLCNWQILPWLPTSELPLKYLTGSVIQIGLILCLLTTVSAGRRKSQSINNAGKFECYVSPVLYILGLNLWMYETLEFWGGLEY